MKHRAQKGNKITTGLSIGVHGSQIGDQAGIGSPLEFKNFDNPISPTNLSGSIENSLLVP